MLGYIGQINAEEYAAHKAKGYEKDDIIGKSGVEQMFESELRGKPGLREGAGQQPGPRDHRVAGDARREPGHDVQLTIDIDAQQVAEESLAAGHRRCTVAGRSRQRLLLPGERRRGRRARRAHRRGRRAGVGAQRSTRTSRRRAAPDEYFDPNGPLPLIDRALNAYAPGSTFKMFTAMAMLKTRR